MAMVETPTRPAPTHPTDPIFLFLNPPRACKCSSTDFNGGGKGAIVDFDFLRSENGFGLLVAIGLRVTIGLLGSIVVVASESRKGILQLIIFKMSKTVRADSAMDTRKDRDFKASFSPELLFDLS
jgi:hypothetical protein